MKNLIFLSLFLGSLWACQSKSTGETTNADSMQADETASEAKRLRPDTINTPASDTTVAAQVLDQMATMKQMSGTYEGKLPCADCEGIQTTLNLDATGGYTMSRVYLGKKSLAPQSDKGQWKSSEDGTEVILDVNKPEEQTRYRHTEGHILTMLGRDGKDIDTKLNFSLTKK